MSIFQLHPTLEKDTFLIKDLKLCRLLLMNNSLYPWVILVPKQDNLVEIIDLSEEDQIQLAKETNEVSKIIKDIFKVDKLNVAALGNMVPQLHIHVVGRFKDDKTFPKPVWVSGEREFYSEEEKERVGNLIQNYL